MEKLNETHKSIQYRLKALEIHPDRLSQWSILVSQEEKIESTVVYYYYCDNKEGFTTKVRLFLTAKYSCIHSSIHVNWGESIKFCLQNEYNSIFINALISTAFVRKISALSEIEKVLFKKRTLANEYILLRSFRQLALIYYKTGDRKRMLNLSKKISFDDDTWKLALAFGLGSPVRGLMYRANILSSAFLNNYNGTVNAPGKRTLFPEKDLCGDVFLPFFFESEFNSKGKFRVIVDERLCSILIRSFPYLDFIPKTPRRLEKDNPPAFSGIDAGLAQYVDNNVLDEIQQSDFFKINFIKYFNDAVCQNNRQSGWFLVDNKKEMFWRKSLKETPKQRLIGFCANSVLQSPSRKMYSIDLECWGSIFKIPNAKFVNLNPSLSKQKIKYLEGKFKVKITNLESVDLYNDFENLLAIMRVLDFAIVPSNSMMDMAASVGLDCLVFSPTKLMLNWVPDGCKNYIFSSKVHFIAPKSPGETKESMVNRAAAYIIKQIS